MSSGRNRVRGVTIIGACLIVAACSDDGPGGSDEGAGGEGAESNLAGTPTEAGTTSSGAPTGGGAGKGPAETSGGVAGTTDGGVAGTTDGGVAGTTDGGVAGTTDGGAGAGGDGMPTTPYLTCPAIGHPLVIDASSNQSQIALAQAFYCDVVKDLLTLTIERVPLATESVVTIWSTHDLSETYDHFKVSPDCATTGKVEPGSAQSYTNYPDMISQLLPASTYTIVTCGSHTERVVEPPPPAPTNVDCAHATPITAQFLQETRILEPSRFYTLSAADEEPGVAFSRAIYFETPQTNAAITGVLRGMSNGYYAEDSVPYALDVPLGFDNLTPDDYCLEVSADIGTRYSLRVGY